MVVDLSLDFVCQVPQVQKPNLIKLSNSESEGREADLQNDHVQH